MAKELYLYNPIYDFVAEDLISAIEDNMGSPITIRENTPGGNVFATFGICAKMIEHGDVTIKVDGAAMSSGANLLPYAKYVECLDVSTFLLHRADMYCESESDKQFLAKINTDLRAKLELRVDADKFKKVCGCTMDEMFNAETRVNVTLDAKQAKSIGLVNKINKLTPAEMTAFNNKMYQVAAIIEEPKQEIFSKMTIDKLKAENPDLYKQIFDLGVEAEKDRVEACLVYNEIDPKAVKEAIESGKPLTAKQMAELNLKSFNVQALKSLENDNPEAVVTTEETKVKTEKEKQLAQFEASAKGHLNLK